MRSLADQRFVELRAHVEQHFAETNRQIWLAALATAFGTTTLVVALFLN